MRVVDAETALATVDSSSRPRVLICFAREEDAKLILRVLERYEANLGVDVVRVEPNEDSAVTLQMVKFPTYALYERGTERFIAVGNDELMTSMDQVIR